MIYPIKFYVDTAMNPVFRSYDATSATEDRNWVATHISITPLTARTKFVDIPGRDGSLDYSEAIGLSFSNRTISFTLETRPSADQRAAKAELWPIHGRKVNFHCENVAKNNGGINQIITGRLAVKSIEVNGAGLTAELELTAEPFSRIQSTTAGIVFSATTSTDLITKEVTYPQVRSEYPPFTITGGSVKLRDANNENEVTLAAGDYSYHPYVFIAENATTMAIHATAVSANATIKAKVHRWQYY